MTNREVRKYNEMLGVKGIRQGAGIRYPTLPTALVNMHANMRLFADRIGSGPFSDEMLCMIATAAGLGPKRAPDDEIPAANPTIDPKQLPLEEWEKMGAGKAVLVDWKGKHQGKFMAVGDRGRLKIRLDNVDEHPEPVFIPHAKVSLLRG